MLVVNWRLGPLRTASCLNLPTRMLDLGESCDSLPFRSEAHPRNGGPARKQEAHHHASLPGFVVSNRCSRCHHEPAVQPLQGTTVAREARLEPPDVARG